MFQASVEGSEASGSRSHFIAARVFVYVVFVVQVSDDSEVTLSRQVTLSRHQYVCLLL